MDKLLVQKYKLMFSLMLGLGIFCLVLAVFAVITLVRYSRLNSNIIAWEEKVAKERTLYGQKPGKVISQLELIKTNLGKKYADYTRLVAAKLLNGTNAVTPLSFKQHLFDVQNRLKNKAEQQKISLPEHLGFEEYESKVPDETQAAFLMKELLMMEEIVDLLLDKRINALLVIEFPKQKEKEENNSGISGRKILLGMTVEINFDELKEFLSGLAEKEKIYRIKTLNIRQQKEKRNLLVEAELEYLEI